MNKLTPTALDARRAEFPLAALPMGLRAFNRVAGEDQRAPLATAELVFTTGAAVKRYDWFRERWYLEQLVVEPGAMRMGRLSRGAPLLNTHSGWDLQSVIGVVDSPAIARGKGTCKATFSRRESVAGYVQDVEDRVIRNVSVGYVRHRMEMVPPEEEDGTWTYRVTDWEPYEVSLVPIPADMDAQVRAEGAALRDGAGRQLRTFPCEITEAGLAAGATQLSKDITMDETNDQLLADEHGEAPLSRSARRAVARQADGARHAAAEAADITELCTRNNMPHLAPGLIRSGKGLDGARSALLDEMARRDAGAGGHRNNICHLSHGNTDESALVLNTLVARLGGRPDGEILRNASCTDLAARTLEAAGVHVDARDSRDRIISRALATRAGHHTTGDFPSLLGNAVGRVLAQRYDENPPALRAVARLNNLPDFRDRQVVRMGMAPSLEKVNEHGEFKYGTVGDPSNSWRLATYGRIIAITRQALVNDDLGGFDTMLSRFAEAAARREAEELVELLLSNPTVDEAVVFSVGNNSQITDVLAIEGLGAAVAKLRAQRESGALVLQAPGALVVPAALEMTARQLVASFTPNEPTAVQPWRLEVVVEPRLDASSATAWYLVSANQRALEYGYLDGMQGVQTITREGFEVDGMELKARLDFGCGWTAPVGWVKSTGAGA